MIRRRFLGRHRQERPRPPGYPARQLRTTGRTLPAGWAHEVLGGASGTARARLALVGRFDDVTRPGWPVRRAHQSEPAALRRAACAHRPEERSPPSPESITGTPGCDVL